MDAKDKFSRLAWTLVESTKDVISTNVVNAMRSGQLKLDAKQLEHLLLIISASVDEGCHRGIPTFQRSTDAIVSDAVKVSASKQPDALTKKK